MYLYKYKSIPINISILDGSDLWLQHFIMLIEKYSYLGAGLDLESMSMEEIWGLYCSLNRLEVSYGTKP